MASMENPGGLVRRVARKLKGRGVDRRSEARRKAILDSGLFDPRWYLEQHPDVAKAGMDPLDHYLQHGHSEMRPPGPVFVTAYYLEASPDVASAGVEPLSHFCEHGWREGRAPAPGFAVTAYMEARKAGPVRPEDIGQFVGKLPVQARSRDQATIARAGLFDAGFYLERYPSVARAQLDPIFHYIEYGAREGRNPAPWFDTAFYLSANPDVASAGMNPFAHFCEAGWKELRNPSPDFDCGWYWVTHMLPQGIDGNPVAHYLAAGDAAPPLPVMEEGKGLSAVDRQALLKQCEEWLDSGSLGLEPMRRVAQLALRLGSLMVAEKAFAKIVSEDWADAGNHLALANAYIQQEKWWLAVESLKAAIAIEPDHPEWHYRLGQAQDAMGRLDDAVDAYQRALEGFPDKSEWHYRLGHALERSNKRELAQEAYRTAILLDKDGQAKKFGEGVYHQKRGLWLAAHDAYSARTEQDPFNAELRYRLGMASDRLYRWEEAAGQYRNAIALSTDTPQPSWHYRLGFVNERMGRFEDAAMAYASAIALSDKHVAYWNYRLGCVLEMMGRLDSACAAFRNTQTSAELAAHKGLVLPFDPQAEDLPQAPDPDLVPEKVASHLAGFSKADIMRESLARDLTRGEPHYQLGEILERGNHWDEAAKAYRAALDRVDAFQPQWFYRLGHVLAKAGKEAEACLAFRQTRMLQRPHGQSEDVLKTNEALRITTSYVEYSETLPVREDVILYESFNGNSLTCNPLALFRELLEHPIYGKYLHVWVLNDPERIPEQYRHQPNVVFVGKGSDGYLRHLATAKYLINNSGFPPYFIRRSGQKYLATWHGTPLKTLGKEQKYKFYDHKRTQRNYLQATHIISPNGHTSGITLDSYDIRPLYTGLFAETGYPRIDMTLNATDAEKARMRARMGLSADRPVVLYAPTWRGTLDNVAFDTTRLEHDLAKLAELDCQVIFRGHSLLERVLDADDVSCTVVPADIDSNALLSIVDVLITDYSSIFFDYLPTGRPVIYYIYDVEEYEQERGLYFPMDEMPGFKCRTIEEVGEAVRASIAGDVGDRVHYERSRAAYNPHDDGRATRRTIDFFFSDARECVLEYREREKRSIVLHGGSFQPNGITTSFTNLVNKLDREADDVIVAMAPTTIETSEACVAQFGKLPRDIYVVPRYGNMPMTLEERWLRKGRDNGLFRIGEEGEALLSEAHAREFRRIFGPKRYDAVVAFSGYDAFWASILLANGLPMRKVAYLHNDMYSEHVHRFPELARMFDLYAHADALVSVSGQTSEHNRENLATRYGLADDKFVFCENVSNAEEIIGKAGQPLESAEDERLFGGAGPVFINIARLSVEKDQEKLIRAFAEFRRHSPAARLLILGTGPLGHHLEQVCQQLGVTDGVHLLGFRSNPYAYLRRADCFVLSSNHEGQPMTLLEALVLSKPVLATDIVGNRSVMEGRGGMLVENSGAGLIAGMQAFVEGRIQVLPFDWQAYNRGAIGHFYERVVADAGRTGV